MGILVSAKSSLCARERHNCALIHQLQAKEVQVKNVYFIINWRSGTKPYLIDVIAPFGGRDEVTAEWKKVIGV